MINTTLCYLEKDGQYLMLHRVKKKQDVNHDKWIGVGGKFEEGESPEECALREVREETGLTMTRWRYRGIVTFCSQGWPCEYMHLFTITDWTGEMLPSCDEGELAWVPKAGLNKLAMWEGDHLFMDLIEKDAPFFSLKLSYQGDTLSQAVLNGERIR